MRIGILGGGQLARMLALAGTPLGMRFMFLAPEADACAASLGTHLQAPFTDQDAWATLATGADRVTCELEHVPLPTLQYFHQRGLLAPSDEAVAIAQERLHEKELLNRLELPTAQYAAVDSAADMASALAITGLPAILKTRRMGYDGKGQAMIREPGEALAAWHSLGEVPAILESVVPFERELSIIGVRGRDGVCRFWPLSENRHRNGILRLSLCRPGNPLQALAEKYCERLLVALDYVGVLALELFQCGDELFANEYAPRVHNSGHWTIEGAVTSQFENHLRAVAGLPLGCTEARGHSAMVNFIGNMPDSRQLLDIPGLHLHSYGKSAAPGRKLGHATLCGATAEQLAKNTERLIELADAAEGAPPHA
ncbi:5-(carboxyamino)imidazole ribonucleotide synthase [Kineobactrum sediminis]|uniref:N5-carboxyaminoimidazole ribonucleotide synthase n=1 Tax=Kineobactrum sediminis TaxID=1905677 RepID=A0A2N5Y6V6_9GAMM|nr:5-(carboxyamino)imidazole ribonucleotide synthase [Kineobactrum sediminis]PLW84099.1 5-(carboxyamino)imidazole ribonucleotide synthase [Kineobactrum sediminis]